MNPLEIDNFSLIIPIFLCILGSIILFFWINKPYSLSILWISIFLLLGGSVLFLQSIIPFNHFYQWSLVFGLLYLSAFIALTQSIALQFNQTISIIICLATVIFVELGLFLYAIISEQVTMRLAIISLGLVIIFCHPFYKIGCSQAKHNIHHGLKLAYYLSCIFLIIQCLFRGAFLFGFNSHHQFTQNYNWLAIQSSIFLLAMIFVSLLIAGHMKEVFSAHQLKLDNIKLQERLKLARDLHDNLGGSLMRSMNMISQHHENLDNQQFLSMLKIFRDDLRQVIDTGASLDAEVPKNPMLWAAPLRHRFSQIFDELNIVVTWDFAERWLFLLTPLESLTLQRVTEEILSNISKHRQITYAKIKLYFSSSQQLIVELEDNGQDFDVHTLNQSVVNVGLLSMQTRLEKIQATMVIQSQSDKNLIQIIKYPCHE